MTKRNIKILISAFALLLVIGVVLILFFHHNTERQPKDPLVDSKSVAPYFNATVIEIYDNSILVESFVDTDNIKCGEKVIVSTNVSNDSFSVPDLEIGTEIAVFYDGTIRETSPAQINKVYNIFLYDELITE